MKTRFNLIISIRALLFVLILQLLSSCSDLFSVRDAENPAGPQTLETAKTPEELIELFKKTFENSNSALYYSLLADSAQVGREYVFKSLAQDVQPGSFIGWNKTQEKLFAERLFKDGNYFVIPVNITPEPFNEPQADSLLLKFNYQMTLIDKNNLKTQIRGNSSFIIIKKNTVWYIAVWQDEYFVLNNEISMSRLKLKIQ